MVVDFTLQQKTYLLKQVVGKEFDWSVGYVYKHGKMKQTKIVSVDFDVSNNFIKVIHNVLFEDGTRHDYCIDGSWFFDNYQKEIGNILNVEVYWEVKQEGVFPVMCSPKELKKSDSWLIAHDYKGRIIFENYSRAMLCWYEKKRT